jgi:hypothetical protein
MTEQELEAALMEVQRQAAHLRQAQEQAIDLPVTGQDSWLAYTQALAQATTQLARVRHLLDVIGMKLYLDHEALVSRAVDHREQMLREEATGLLGSEPTGFAVASYLA